MLECLGEMSFGRQAVAPVFNPGFGCPLGLARIASLPTGILLHRPKAGHGICLYGRFTLSSRDPGAQSKRETRENANEASCERDKHRLTIKKLARRGYQQGAVRL